MNSTANRLEILYCPKCKVGMDATLSRQAACPRCGGQRKRIRGHARLLAASCSLGMAEQLFSPLLNKPNFDELIHKAQDYFLHP